MVYPYLIRIHLLEQINSLLEIIGNFFLGIVLGITGNFHCAYAGAMLVPFMRPEALVITLVIFPEDVHIVQHLCSSAGIHDASDV